MVLFCPYAGQGVDQVADLVHRIKTTPEDRRLILTAWNPAALKEVALPPCHMMCQVRGHSNHMQLHAARKYRYLVQPHGMHRAATDRSTSVLRLLQKRLISLCGASSALRLKCRGF